MREPTLEVAVGETLTDHRGSLGTFRSEYEYDYE